MTKFSSSQGLEFVPCHQQFLPAVWSTLLTFHTLDTTVLCKVLGLTIKKRIYSFKLLLFFNIISLKTNTFILAMLQRHYAVPVVVLRKICKIPLYSCNRLLIRRKTLTSEEEFEFWEETEVRGSQIWGIG